MKLPPADHGNCNSLLFVYLFREEYTEMDDILKKLKYREQERIAVLNAPRKFLGRITRLLPGVQIDSEINARFLYDFMIAFTPGSAEVDKYGPACIHNLSEDGKLWMVYPKSSSRRYKSNINRNRGWETVTNTGFKPVGQVAIDEDWSALRFRNVKFIKTGK